jgi:outer membrane immunogenic protein
LFVNNIWICGPLADEESSKLLETKRLFSRCFHDLPTCGERGIISGRDIMKAFITALAVCAVSATSVSAADLGGRRYSEPSFKDDYAVAYRPFSWTGFYAGLNAGAVFGNDDDVTTTGQALANVNNVNGGARPGTVGLDRSGFTGGGQLGYNWQMGGIVAGIETDINYTDMSDSTQVTTTALNGVDSLRNNFNSRLDYLGTVRGRLGFVAYDRTLFYVTGGFAYGDVENSVALFGPAGQLQFAGRKSGVETGYVVGGGIEHALSSNWTLKGEYLYYDLGSQTVAANVVPGSGGGGTGYNSKFENDGHMLRLGVNYKF